MRKPQIARGVRVWPGSGIPSLAEQFWALPTRVPRLGRDLADLTLLRETELFPSQDFECSSDSHLPALLGGSSFETFEFFDALRQAREGLRCLLVCGRLRCHEPGSRLPTPVESWHRQLGERFGRGRLAAVGPRDYTKDEETWFRSNQRLVGAADVSFGRGLQALVDELRGRPVVLHMDLDLFDPIYAPAVAEPSGYGLSQVEVFAALGVLSECNIVGISVGAYTEREMPTAARAWALEQTARLGAETARECLLCIGRSSHGTLV